MAAQRGTAGPQTIRPHVVVLAAAIAATAELLIYRVTLPVISHIPGSDLGTVGSVVEGIGQRSFEATAVLVIAGAALIAFTALRSQPTLAVALVAALASVAIGLTTSSEWAALAARALLVGAVAAVAAHAWTSLPVPLALAHGGAVVAVLAGQWPLLVQDAAATTGDVISGTLVSANIGELALVLTPALFAVAYLRGGSPSRSTWVVAAGVGLIAAALLARRPDYSAIISSWAVGATLSLPPFLYVVSASCLALVMLGWLREPAARPYAAGLVLLAAAALQPAVVHHNLTAVVALVLLAVPPEQATEPAALHPTRRKTWIAAEVGGTS